MTFLEFCEAVSDTELTASQKSVLTRMYDLYSKEGSRSFVTMVRHIPFYGLLPKNYVQWINDYKEHKGELA